MNPHLHVLLHLPNAKLREELQAALTAVYGYTHSGGLVAKVVAGTDRRIRHESGYWGSTFDYITRHKTQQAYRARGGSTWRASRRDENGRHRGIKCPFVGRRWNVSRNINAKARQAQRDGAAMIAARAAQRIAAGAIVRRMSDADIGKGLSGVPPYPTGEVLQQTIECRCNVRRGRNCDRVGVRGKRKVRVQLETENPRVVLGGLWLFDVVAREFGTALTPIYSCTPHPARLARALVVILARSLDLSHRIRGIPTAVRDLLKPSLCLPRAKAKQGLSDTSSPHMLLRF